MHPYVLENCLKNNVSDISEHLLYQLGIRGRGWMLVDFSALIPVLILKLFCDESICIVDTVDKVFI